ncbi:MAG: hypothetical protein ABI411_01785 [Tahibacter sp.]
MSDHYDFEPTESFPSAVSAERAHEAVAPPAVSGAAQGGSGEFDVLAFARGLVKLGPVLWLERSARRVAPWHAPLGRNGVMLLEHHALLGLGRCHQITAHASVTSQGPREWFRCGDIHGIALSKLFLLPDTDYFSWDEMVANSRWNSLARLHPSWPAHGPYARLGGGWRARLLSFDLRNGLWLHSLGARDAAHVSPLGLELARSIASSEGAELISSLQKL